MVKIHLSYTKKLKTHSIGDNKLKNKNKIFQDYTQLLVIICMLLEVFLNIIEPNIMMI